MSAGLIAGRRPRPWQLPTGAKPDFRPDGYYLGAGQRSQLEVAIVRCTTRPPDGDVRTLWKKRRGSTPSPLLLIVVWASPDGERASVCGTTGDEPSVYADRDAGQVTRLAEVALGEPDHHAATRFLNAYLPEETGGLRNVALFASHHLTDRVPRRADWTQMCQSGQAMLGLRREQLITKLGFTLEPRGHAAVLRTAGQATALAVFLDDAEHPDSSIARFNGVSPISWALAAASADNIPYVVVTRGSQLRIHTTRAGAGIGGKGGSSAFLELNLPLLTADDAGYLPLLCSAASLAPGGAFEQLLAESSDFASDLGIRLRTRVYDHTVPAIAQAFIGHHHGDQSPGALSALYEQALLVLFRLMFIAYAEDRDLLPLRSNGLYRPRSLKQIARELAEQANVNDRNHVAFDQHSTDLWDRFTALCTAVDKGRPEWQVPAYNGGMFATDVDVNPHGAAIALTHLTNRQFGPALMWLLVDDAGDDRFGPVDFASLDVREFGTIYEGLLESSLAVAPTDLTVSADGTWMPVTLGQSVLVAQGEIYLHNSGGARKASGSYFTKPFAVNHLLTHALEPALDSHIHRLRDLLAAGDEAGAAEAFFDFRCIDLAMGSGHFLVAAVDVIERRLSSFLTEHRLPRVLEELDRLAAAATDNLAVAGIVGEGTDTNALLRRQIGRRCIYGVDLNPVAVELARLALWVHTFVKGLPLTNLNHGLVVGNSLTGIGELDEVAAILDPTAPDGTMSVFSEAFDGVLTQASGAVARFSATSEANATEVRSARTAHQEATVAVAPVRQLLDYAIAVRLGWEPAPTVLTLADLSLLAAAFDPATIAPLRPLHFPIAFPEVFSRTRPGFDCILGNPPWQEATLEEPAFWARHNPGLRSKTAAQKTQEIARHRVNRPDLHAEFKAEKSEQDAVRAALMAGPYKGMGTGDPDLYKGFIWRFVTLSRQDGHVGVVLPRQALASAGSAPWRQHVLANAAFTDLCLLLNTGRWVFDMEPRYTVGLCSIVVGEHHAGTARLRGPYASQARYDAGIASGSIATVDATEMASWTENASIPLVPSEEAMRVFLKLRAHPRLDADIGWRARPVTELHATNEKKEMILDTDRRLEGLWPVYKGESFDIWKPDSGTYYALAEPAYIQDYLYAKRIRQQRLARSAFSAFTKRWAQDRATLPCLHPRIAFRDISRATDTRTVRAALIAPQRVIANQAPYLLWSKGDATDEAYLLGILCSIPFDWYARRVVENHLNFHIFNAFPVPRPTLDDPLRLRVAQIAGRLAAVDARYQDWADQVGVPVGSIVDDDEKNALIQELDALAALLFGLDVADVSTIFNTFHDGWDAHDRLCEVQTYMHRWQGSSDG